jgi:hypothetical protein
MLSSEQNPEVFDPSTSASFPISIGTMHLLSKEQKDERSVARNADSSTAAGYINLLPFRVFHQKKKESLPSGGTLINKGCINFILLW